MNWYKTKHKLLATLLPAFFMALLSLYWLALATVLLGAAYILLTSRYAIFVAFRKKFWLCAICMSVFALALAISLRVFVFEIYSIPSGSMENSLLVGDKIVMSKLHYGPRMPRSPFEIPWLNLFAYMNKEARAAIDSTWWDYERLNGFSAVKRKDIVVFYLPGDDEHFYIKRCMGLPGEVVQVKNGLVYADKLKIASPPATQNLGEDFPIKIVSKNDSLTWSANNWGPVEIPKKGETVTLKDNNWIFYQRILGEYEDVEGRKEEQFFYINGKKVDSYTFKNNYYFMLGDNRHNSIDSRFWGFVPEENILGKAVMVLYSANNNKIKWNRTLKILE